MKYDVGLCVGGYILLSWAYKKSATNYWTVGCLSCGRLTVKSPAQLKQEPRKGCRLCTDGTATHGRPNKETPDRTYCSWSRMLQRVRGTDPKAWHAQRGILVCVAWLTFENFLSEMGERPANTSLDRIDNDGHYCKDNCRWASREQQASNHPAKRPEIKIHGFRNPDQYFYSTSDNGDSE